MPTWYGTRCTAGWVISRSRCTGRRCCSPWTGGRPPRRSGTCLRATTSCCSTGMSTSNAAYGSARLGGPQVDTGFAEWVAELEVDRFGVPCRTGRSCSRPRWRWRPSGPGTGPRSSADRALDRFESDAGLQQRTGAMYRQLAAQGLPVAVDRADAGAGRARSASRRVWRVDPGPVRRPRRSAGRRRGARCGSGRRCTTARPPPPSRRRPARRPAPTTAWVTSSAVTGPVRPTTAPASDGDDRARPRAGDHGHRDGTQDAAAVAAGERGTSAQRLADGAARPSPRRVPAKRQDQVGDARRARPGPSVRPATSTPTTTADAEQTPASARQPFGDRAAPVPSQGLGAGVGGGDAGDDRRRRSSTPAGRAARR